MDTFDTFHFGSTIDSYGPVQVDQRLEWFQESTHRVCIEGGFAAVVFKFKIWTQQLIEFDGKNPDDLTRAGKRSVHGTLSLVTKEYNLLERPFSMLVYRNTTGKRVAMIHYAMLTSFSQEYSLDDQHIVEAEFCARNMELHK